MLTLSDSNRPNDVPVLPLTELGRGGDPSASNTSQRIQSVATRPIIVADLGFPPNLVEPDQALAWIVPDDSLYEKSKLNPVIEISKYHHSQFYPFDHLKSQSPETADNSNLQPRYNNMIFFDPKENIDPPRDQADQRRKKFLTVISANSILPRASPSPSPSKQTEISETAIQNTYQQSLIKMKDILIEIENLRYDKNEIIEACQYARQFKGIANGRDGVIAELQKDSALCEDEIKAKFERLKTISFLFQQKCFQKDIFSGRDENSLKSEFKFANGTNNRPGLRLTYIPDKAFEMYKRHNAAVAVELSATPAAARMST